MAKVATPKLVRDKVPTIITEKGEVPHIRVAVNPKEQREFLEQKLEEEVAEFLSAKTPQISEELADIIEVVHAIAHHYGVSVEKLEQIRLKKREARGGFVAQIILESVSEQ